MSTINLCGTKNASLFEQVEKFGAESHFDFPTHNNKKKKSNRTETARW